MDDYVIKEESIEDSDEKLITIEIKEELYHEYETTSENLKVLMEIKQKVLRYPCSECDYEATQKGNLLIHTKSKHEGARIPFLFQGVQVPGREPAVLLKEL